jgi:hypothetical protein
VGANLDLALKECLFKLAYFSQNIPTHLLKSDQISVIIVTKQASIAKGYFTIPQIVTKNRVSHVREALT